MAQFSGGRSCWGIVLRRRRVSIPIRSQQYFFQRPFVNGAPSGQDTPLVCVVAMEIGSHETDRVYERLSKPNPDAMRSSSRCSTYSAELAPSASRHLSGAGSQETIPSKRNLEATPMTVTPIRMLHKSRRLCTLLSFRPTSSPHKNTARG
jgi:hypothetical protein